MSVTNQQVRKVMDELEKHGKIGLAAMRAGMDRATARKYRNLDKLPSELKTPRTWRTRADPFEADWPYLRAMLENAPELEAAILLDHLMEVRPGCYQEGQVRTLQRRVKRWRAEEGPPKTLFFPQEHRPGEAMQTDFTCANALGVTICGVPFEHKLCHAVLPYSNWEWVTVCRSESMAALRRGIQAAIFELGRIPDFHQTDNSTAATHRLDTGKRDFNNEYLDLMAHFAMKPRTTGIGEKEQNGDVESLNGAFKRRLAQYLLLRGSTDFDSVAVYEAWLQNLARKFNRTRAKRLEKELSMMRRVNVARLAEFSEVDVRVAQGSTIRVKSNVYSVPSRLRGEKVRVRVYDDRLEVYYAQKHQFTVERLRGRGRHRINYRHLIHSFVEKPGAFDRYRYREDLFPSLTFRLAFDALDETLPRRQADLEYLRCLRLAAETMESEVEVALALLLESGALPIERRVRELVKRDPPAVPEVVIDPVDLTGYDALLNRLTLKRVS